MAHLQPKENNMEKNVTRKIKVFNGLTDIENNVLKAVSSEAIDVDGIIRTTGLKPNDVLNILLTLELRGIIKQLPGKKFVLNQE